jgi:hypothetical protein
MLLDQGAVEAPVGEADGVLEVLSTLGRCVAEAREPSWR